jgi:lipopolysaccharide transport system ATP-binding protein
MTYNNAISIRDVSKHYKIYARPQDRLKQMVMRNRHYFTDHDALKSLSLDIFQGETVGIIGCNGSGKSTLLQMICGTLTPSTGTIEVSGRISALLELGAGFNPEFTGRENIWLNASILGLSRDEIAARYDDIVAFSGLPLEYLDRPVKTYSSGMYVRLAFAVAIAVDPDILIVDEALAVGDESFQRKCFARIKSLQEQGKTILFVSHAAETMIELCSRAVLLDRGELLMQGTPKEVITAYHKMIFAPDTMRDSIRDGIKEQFSTTLRLEQQTDSEAKAEENSQLPDDNGLMKLPETRVEYPSNGAVISSPSLQDEHGTPVSLLHIGKKYRLHYHVKFDGNCGRVRFATFFKTRTGQQLAGAICDAYTQQLPHVFAGDEVDVYFHFTCTLSEGVYFLNCGVTELQDSNDIFLHRIVDALQCRVLPQLEREGDMLPTGLVDIGLRCEVHKS